MPVSLSKENVMTDLTTSARRYDLDWLRFIAIIILLFFHTGMLFNQWGWHVKNPETTTTFSYWMIWSHFFRMPLLLFISGAGTYMALGKRTPGQFAGNASADYLSRSYSESSLSYLRRFIMSSSTSTQVIGISIKLFLKSNPIMVGVKYLPEVSAGTTSGLYYTYSCSH